MVSIAHFYFAQIGHYHFVATAARKRLQKHRKKGYIKRNVRIPESEQISAKSKIEGGVLVETE
jgi:hypothetical protein